MSAGCTVAPNARKVVEILTSSHLVMISQPKIVARLVLDAAEAVS
ncbi:pimeloyl-ACP methyl ester carboxylesterase [Catenulispora sp. EB89]